MRQESSPLGKAAVILLVVAGAAALLSLLFGRALAIEPVGVFSFGLFCVGYSALIPFLSRLRERRRAAFEADAEQSGARNRVGSIGANVVWHPGTHEGKRPLDSRPRHALTVDLEDYFHTEVAAQGVSFAQWEQQPSRIEASTHRLLDLLDGQNTRATFFVLGWVARRYPHLVAEIHQRGHEIGCHSMDHRLVCRMTPAEFYDNTRAARDLIESITLDQVVGYRAPCFSITPGCEWAFDVLARLGFSYDSSVHPVNHPLYGNPSAPRTAYPVANGRLTEFPIATWKVGGRNLSVGGGAYLRLLPYQYIHKGLVAWEKQMKVPAMLYLHPWEIDPYQPYIPLSLQSTIRQTWGTATMENKLRHLLESFRFAPVREVYGDMIETRMLAPVKAGFQRAAAAEQVAG